MKKKGSLDETERLKVIWKPDGREEQARLALYQSFVRNELRYPGMQISAHPVALLGTEAARYGCV